MFADYTIGFFAIQPEMYKKVEPLFAKAAGALENFDLDCIDVANDAYQEARAFSLKYAELDQIEDVEPYTAFGEVVELALKNVAKDTGIYSSVEVPVYWDALKNLESRWGGEKGVVDKMWANDKSQQKDAVRKFYLMFMGVLKWAAQNNCAFAHGSLG